MRYAVLVLAFSVFLAGNAQAKSCGSCNDNNACTSDSCNTSTGNCVFANNTSNCNDNNACTSNDKCAGGACSGTNNTNNCSDNNACTSSDKCAGGACGGTPKVCNDGNGCTADSCNTSTGNCVFTNTTAPCSDGNACTTGDACAGGSCAPGPATVCSDGNGCTTDSCDTSTGSCVFTNNTAVCDDGNACTAGDTCGGGTCVSGAATVCTAADICHLAGTCSPATGVCSSPNQVDGTACDDGDVCTQPDACQAGVCRGTAALPVGLVSANGDLASIEPRLSDDGRFVAFESLATTLVAGDTNTRSDVFVTDRQAGTTTRISVTDAGIQATGESHRPFISSTGRYIAFDSNAPNLAGLPVLGAYHVLVRDTETGTMIRASSDNAGNPANSSSYEPSVSADGRYVVFYSWATNLTAGDTNNNWDVFVRDTQAGTTTRISQDVSGVQGNGMSFSPSISPDGRYVVFTSLASNLVAGDTNGQADIFLYDRQGNEMFRVSVTSTGAEANAGSYRGRISADGRYLTFMSLATNLVSGDTNGTYDIFLRDLAAGLTTRASVGPAGVQGDGPSIRSVLTADGGYVVFQSSASNLVFDDTNTRQDVFQFNRSSGVTTRISRNADGSQSLIDSVSATVSADGQYVGFQSAATLAAGDVNGAVVDAYVAPRPCP